MSASIWAMSMMIVLMLKVMTYFLLLFLVGKIVGLGLIRFLRPVVKFIQK
jgi:hypothetical protein